MKIRGREFQLCIRWCHSLRWIVFRDRQQICVAVTIVENPGSVERQTKDGAALVCNAIVQHGATRVKFSLWHEQAEESAAQPPGTNLMLFTRF